MGWNRIHALTLAALCTSSLPVGCGLATLQSNLDDIDFAEVRGSVSVQDWNESPVVVGVLRLADVDGAPDQPVTRRELIEPGEFVFYLPPGRYRIAAWEDTNHNLEWDEAEERVGGYNGLRPFELRAGERRGRVDIHITVRRLSEVPDIAELDLARLGVSIGTVVALSHGRFAPPSGRRGLWQPMQFLDDPGWGIFMLEEYDPDKVPVLFVHGMGGHPQEFARLIDGLDRARLQPWVVHYPSGLDLEILALAIQNVLSELRHRHGYERMCLVAHSAGGVLSRLLLRNHREEEGRFVRTFVSIVSPFNGVPSAGRAASSAPVVLPAWRDLDPSGRTIPTLFDARLPEGLDYHLFFAHQDGSSDTVVSLGSQLRAEAMAEATTLRGFSNTHAGILRDSQTSERLNAALRRCSGLPPIVAIAPTMSIPIRVAPYGNQYSAGK